MTDLPLTPHEAFVLLDPDPSKSVETFKIALLFLVAIGVLKVTPVEKLTVFLIRIMRPVVSVAREPPAIFLAAETVDVVRKAFTTRAPERDHSFYSVAYSATKTFGSGFWKLYAELICPALAARGWLEPTERMNHPMAGGHYMRYRHTPAGLGEKQRIHGLIDRARRIPSLIDTNPAEAKAIVLAAGSLLLLVPELKAIYGKLAMLDTGIAPDVADAVDFGNLDAKVLDSAFDYFDELFDD